MGLPQLTLLGLCRTPYKGMPFAEAMVKKHLTPVYIYSKTPITIAIQELRDAMADLAKPRGPSIYYSMKANRHPLVIGTVIAEGCGLYAASIEEVVYAIKLNCKASHIHYLPRLESDKEYMFLATEGVKCTFESTMSIQQYSKFAKDDKTIGLSIDTHEFRHGHGRKGFLLSEIADACATAAREGLTVTRLHTHLGWAIQSHEADQIRSAFTAIRDSIEGVTEGLALEEFNLGGGLAHFIPGKVTESPMSCKDWASIAKGVFGPNIGVSCEPGTFLVQQCGILATKVQSKDVFQGTPRLGVDAGYSVDPAPAMYNISVEVVPLREEECEMSVWEVVGPSMTWSTARLPETVRIGDVLLLMNQGAYAASQANRHCLKGEFNEVIADEYLQTAGQASIT